MNTITNEMYDEAYEARGDNRVCGTCEHFNLFRACELHQILELSERAHCAEWKLKTEKGVKNGLHETSE